MKDTLIILSTIFFSRSLSLNPAGRWVETKNDFFILSKRAKYAKMSKFSQKFEKFGFAKIFVFAKVIV
jgi:hypothetical protein